MTMLQPNYCRNHDYNNDFNWTYKVKTNVYKCFVEARNEKNHWIYETTKKSMG